MVVSERITIERETGFFSWILGDCKICNSQGCQQKRRIQEEGAQTPVVETLRSWWMSSEGVGARPACGALDKREGSILCPCPTEC